MQMFEVGGCVRDEIMGVKSNDIDFSVVLEASDFPDSLLVVGGNDDPFLIMEKNLIAMGFDVKVRTPEHLTIRALFPKNHPTYSGGADFVLARKEGAYSDGRRPDFVVVGSLQDDLRRRDFTMNAIAKAEDGSLVDPFNGRQDIADGVIRAVGDAFLRLDEDALRALRALRFSVTKGFRIDPALRFHMENVAILDKIVNNISDDRKKDELNKMFKFDTLASLRGLNDFPALTAAIFSGSVSLEATMKTKGRGKS